MRRLPDRGRYDRQTIDSILDEALICHVGFVHDSHPYVIPTIHARAGDRVLLHGSAASRMLLAAAGGIDVCVTATIVDGLVLARSAFHHSMNYRSVVVLGTAVPVTDPDEKLAALETISEHVIPGRWQVVRKPTQKELKATLVLSLPITEASAKVRVGPPKDDEGDYGLSIWAGELPLALSALPPRSDPVLRRDILPPAHALHYARGIRSEAGPTDPTDGEQA